MSDRILQQLQQTADSNIQDRTIPEGAPPIPELMVSVSEQIERLKSAHSNLQERFEAVNQELAIKTAKLKRSMHYLDHVLRNVSEAILFIDLEGTITIFNEAAQNFLKLKPEQVLFKKFWEVFADDSFGFSMREALTFGISHQLFAHKEREISTAFLYEGPKPHHGMILVCRDVREKHLLQGIAHRNDRMRELGEIAAAAAHEIRNRLGGIRGYGSLLHRDLKESPHLQEMAGFILEGARGLENTVGAMLHYSKQIAIELQTLDLGAFLKQVAKFVKMDPGCPSHIKLSLHVPDAPLCVSFDPEALKGALLNLIFNAFQAMPQGGELILSLLKMESSCQIAITDTGEGMDEEELDRLFSPFYTTKKGGNGLGLAETQKIIRAHGGAIDVRSQKGRGSTFTLTLPLKR